MAFTQIPTLDLSEATSPSTKPAFLTQLRTALLECGFLYIKNTGISQDLYDRVCRQGISFFELDDEEKMEIEMKNQPSFLGYSRVSVLIKSCSIEVRFVLTSYVQLGNETTAHRADWREQIDLSTPHPLRKQTDPLYYSKRA